MIDASPDAGPKRVARSFLTLGSGEALARLVAFGATVYVARVLGPESYGVLELAAAIVLYLSRVADLGIDQGLGVQEIATGRADLPELVPAILTVRTLVASLLAVAVAGVGLLVLPGEEGRILSVYGLTLIAVGASTRWIHIGRESTTWPSVARIVGELLMVGLVFAFVRIPADLIRVPLARLAGDFLTIAILAWSARRLGIALRPRIRTALLKPLVSRAGPLVLSALLSLAIYNADLLFIRILTGHSASVGFYAAAYTLVGFLANLGVVYAISLLPTLTRLAGDRQRQLALFETAHAHVFAAGLPVAIGGSLLADEIIGAVFGRAYDPAVLALQIVIWAVPLGYFCGVRIVGLMASRREDRVLRFTAWAAASNVLLNLLLIPPYGIYGAALASLVTEGLRLALALRVSEAFGWPLPRAACFWRPALAGLTMAASLHGLGSLALPTAIGIGAAVYLGTLAVLGGIRFRGGRPPAADV